MFISWIQFLFVFTHLLAFPIPRYMIFVWFWTSQFIVAVGQLVVSLAVSIWFFSKDRKREVSNYTFIRSLCLVLVYHLGTAAFGSLIIAVVKTIRAVLTYMQKKLRKSKLRIAVVILAALKCLLWCLEKCLKFVNKQAYIQTGMRSILASALLLRWPHTLNVFFQQYFPIHSVKHLARGSFSFLETQCEFLRFQLLVKLFYSSIRSSL